MRLIRKRQETIIDDLREEFEELRLSLLENGFWYSRQFHLIHITEMTEAQIGKLVDMFVADATIEVRPRMLQEAKNKNDVGYRMRDNRTLIVAPQVDENDVRDEIYRTCCENPLFPQLIDLIVDNDLHEFLNDSTYTTLFEVA